LVILGLFTKEKIAELPPVTAMTMTTRDKAMTAEENWVFVNNIHQWI